MHPRIVAEDAELAGYRLPAGSELLLSIFHMHHDPAVFSDPDCFRPRRWEAIKPSVYEYNPSAPGLVCASAHRSRRWRSRSFSRRSCSDFASSFRNTRSRPARGHRDGADRRSADARSQAPATRSRTQPLCWAKFATSFACRAEPNDCAGARACCRSLFAACLPRRRLPDPVSSHDVTPRWAGDR